MVRKCRVLALHHLPMIRRGPGQGLVPCARWHPCRRASNLTETLVANAQVLASS